MRTLNGRQKLRGEEMHLCPLQFDIVDRLIEQFSNEGETVFDPFAGIGTVPFCAIKQGRRGVGVELSGAYFTDAVFYCEAAEREISAPTLFDALELDKPETREEQEPTHWVRPGRIGRVEDFIPEDDAI
jgi:tRNA/tmRNA/rRNA uracil-C5-methylase (TrmA/RlmC/RlmD family)